MTVANFYSILVEVSDELAEASEKFPPFASAHEGYAIILEELEELWQEIKMDKQPTNMQRERMRKEAVQLAAMSLRFIMDVTP